MRYEIHKSECLGRGWFYYANVVNAKGEVIDEDVATDKTPCGLYAKLKARNEPIDLPLPPCD